jgi:hypothetical protein
MTGIRDRIRHACSRCRFSESGEHLDTGLTVADVPRDLLRLTASRHHPQKRRGEGVPEVAFDDDDSVVARATGAAWRRG